MSWLFKFLPLLILANSAHAFDVNRIGVGYGILNSNLFELSQDATGKAGTFGEFSYNFLEVNSLWTIGLNQWVARVAYTVIPRETADEATDISHLLLSGQYGHRFYNDWMFRIGLGILQTTSRGNGGAIILNNGTGTSTFYRPSNTQTVNQLNIETGISYDFTRNFAMNVDFLINGIMREKRNFSLYINFTYYWSLGGGSAVVQDTNIYSGGY